jgi:MFS family permease
MERERRDLLLLAAGTLASVAGDTAAMVALLLELRTHGVGWVSGALGADLLPAVLLAAPSGRLVDRVDNRRLLVIGLVGQALIAVPLALARSPWLVVALFFALSVVSTVVRPAANAMVPVLSEDRGASKGFASISTGVGIGVVIGPALGGILTSAFGVTATLSVDAGTFLVMGIGCSLLSTTRKPEPTTAHEGRPHGGFQILRRDRILYLSIVATTVATACAVIDNVAGPFRFLDQLGTSSAGYGAYLALWGVGVLAGSQIPRRLNASALPVTLALGNGVTGLGILGIGLAPSLTVALAASVFGGIGNGLANVSQSALIAERVVEAERGRAYAASSGFLQTGIGLGTVAGAPIVAAVGAGHAMAGAGGFAAVLAGITAFWMLGRRTD